MLLFIKTIIAVKTSVGMTIAKTVVVLLLVWFFMFAAIPFVFYGMFGVGDYATQMAEKPITSLLTTILPVLFGLGFCSYKIWEKFRSRNLDEAKSYLLAGFIFLALYPFRIQIVNVASQVSNYFESLKH